MRLVGDTAKVFHGGIFEVSEVEIVGHSGAKDDVFVEVELVFFKDGVGGIACFCFVDAKDLMLGAGVFPIRNDATFGVEVFSVLNGRDEARHCGFDIFLIHTTFESVAIVVLGGFVVEFHEAIVEALVNEAWGNELVHAKDIRNGFAEPGLLDFGKVDFGNFIFQVNRNAGDLVEVRDECFV